MRKRACLYLSPRRCANVIACAQHGATELRVRGGQAAVFRAEPYDLRNGIPEETAGRMPAPQSAAGTRAGRHAKSWSAAAVRYANGRGPREGIGRPRKVIGRRCGPWSRGRRQMGGCHKAERPWSANEPEGGGVANGRSVPARWRTLHGWRWSSRAARDGRAEAMKELMALRRSRKRGRPYGEASWVGTTARRLGVESSLRPVGRPKKSKGKQAKKGL